MRRSRCISSAASSEEMHLERRWFPHAAITPDIAEGRPMVAKL
jgi:hypothetical protein